MKWSLRRGKTRVREKRIAEAKGESKEKKGSAWRTLEVALRLDLEG